MHIPNSRQGAIATWATLICLAVFCSPAAARWYQVEVIVFKHVDAGNIDGEQWPELQRLPNFATATELVSRQNAESPAGEQLSAFQPSSRETLRLSGVYRQLQQSNAYDPVLHKAWVQPGYGANSVRRVYLSDKRRESVLDERPIDLLSEGVEENEWIEGTIGLQGGRLLHVGANFIYRAGEITAEVAEFRRVKLKELHYFDHPLFGILVQVTPFRAANSPAVKEPELPEDGG